MAEPRHLADIPLPDRFVAIAAEGVEELLQSQQADGHFETGAHFKPFSPTGQGGIYALAWLYLTPQALNPFQGDARLWDSVMRCADCLVENLGEDGKFHYDSGGYQVAHFDQWVGLAWLETFVLLRDQLDKSRHESWRKALIAGSQELHDWIIKVNEQETFHTRSFQTSPNHAVTRAAMLYRAGQVFEHSEWRDVVDAFIRKFLNLQTVDGFWPEYEGPVLGYAFVSLDGLGLYHAYTGDEATRAALERTATLFSRIMVARGGAAMPFDTRQQHPGGRSMRGLFALSVSDEGRGLIDDLAAPYSSHIQRQGFEMSLAVRNFVHWIDGPAVPPPYLKDRFGHALRIPGGVARSRPWSWSLSGISTPPFPDGPFCIEHQTLLSLWHDEAGCVINGANSKERYEAATFQSQQNPADALPVDATLNDEITHLAACFKTFTGEITMKPAKDGSFGIGAAVSNVRKDDSIAFRLQLGAKFDDVVALDGKERRLGADDWSVEGVREVAFGNVRLSFDRPARLWWPFRGYNSYTSDHTYPDLTSARLIAEVMLSAEKEELTIKVIGPKA